MIKSKHIEEIKSGCRLKKEPIYKFLKICDDLFVNRLSSMVNLSEYSEKISKKSLQACYYVNGDLVGMSAFYTNNQKEKIAYISIICIKEDYQGKGIGKILLNETIKHIKTMGFHSIKMEVNKKNKRSFNLYKKFGFDILEEKENSMIVGKDL